MKTKHPNLLIPIILILIMGCGQKVDLEPAFQTLDIEGLKKHIAVLASDDFMGRAPLTEGEEKTIHYLADAFREVGCKPGNGDSYFQEVPVLETAVNPKSRLTIAGNGQIWQLRFPDSFAATTARPEKNVSIRSSNMVFVGYGIVAPEYDWNDYAGLDVKGKTVLILVNDPGFATEDDSLFTGRAMTYYGRWTYKYEEAARQGAEAAIIVHETEPAAYPWSVVRNGHTGPQLYFEQADDVPLCEIHAWIQLADAESLFKSMGKDYAAEKKAANKRGFQGYAMGLKATLNLRNSVRFGKTNNVAALIPGSERPDEVVIYTAHWDHFGMNPDLDGDQIFNGALDNATGTAALIELAQAFQALPVKPKRSILFLPVTAEEQGLLGSAYYAAHPLYPAEKTAGVINIDALCIEGPMKDVTVVGYGYSELDDIVLQASNYQDRYVTPDPTPEKGSYFRSDHFSFAKVGIPSVYIAKGSDHVEHGRDWTLKKRAKWGREHYHKPSDNYTPDLWDFEGMIQDVRLVFHAGYLLAMEDGFPNWREGIPFKAMRDEMIE